MGAYPLFHTRDIDRARQNVARKFCSHDLTPGRHFRQFEARHNHVSGTNLSLNYLSYGCEVAINPGELERFYLIQLPLAGTARVQNGRVEVAADRATASVLNPTRETRMTWHSGCRKLLLQIDRAALHTMAEALLGRRLSKAVVFDPKVDLTQPGLQRWAAALRSAVSLAQNLGAFGGHKSAHQARLEEELMLGFLMHQPSNIQHGVRQGHAFGAAPFQLRRALDYMRGNLGEPLTLAQIAAEADCSLRSLQVGFRRHFHCTPMQYLTQERLAHAHYLLQSQPTDQRVSTVAFDAGFSHLGRFSIAYRAAYGRSPRDTLGRGGPA
ncbi:AraC family transcriptional regulator [Pseudophaeobacter sp.]|uniref:AraC family transcriptional regulator n=1 Tax=Pseudophaeobacter sp. TaxID=1971739 RepID=UPI003299DC9F